MSKNKPPNKKKNKTNLDSLFSINKFHHNSKLFVVVVFRVGAYGKKG
jgi:hypothetical protein